MKTIIFFFSIIISLVLPQALSQDFSSESEFSEAELAQMLAPIALYPDSLLTHVLIAATYPLEIVEAQRWAEKNEDLTSQKITLTLENIDWEPSVKALVSFPSVLNRLNDDLTWTRNLGDAFLQDESSVLESIQQLREQAEQAGSLSQMDNVQVSREDNNIIIQPIQHETIYVPYYDTRVVYGGWHWSHFPPVHWARRNTHYRSEFSAKHGLFAWHRGIHISFDYFFSGFHWNNRHVVVVNHRNSRDYRQRRYIVHGSYAKKWQHKPHHRKGIAYRNHTIKKRFNSHKASVSQSRYHRANEKKLIAQYNRDKRTSIGGRGHKPQRKTKHEALKHRIEKRTLPQRNLAQKDSAKQRSSKHRAPKHSASQINAAKQKKLKYKAKINQGKVNAHRGVALPKKQKPTKPVSSTKQYRKNKGSKNRATNNSRHKETNISAQRKHRNKKSYAHSASKGNQRK